jgi:vacuolar-type H+-ATPase subunit I/STV1
MWKKKLLLLFLAFSLGRVYSEESSIINIQTSVELSPKLLKTELPNSSFLNDDKSNNSNEILPQQMPQSPQPSQIQEPSMSSEETLSQLLSAQINDLKSLKTNLDLLKTFSNEQLKDNSELRALLTTSEQTIKSLETNLQNARQRLKDSNDGAASILDENIELFDKVNQQVARIQQLEKQLSRVRIAGFGFGILGGVGISVITIPSEINTKDRLIIGSGIIIGSGLIWTLGHFVFQIW